jgi:ABC-type glycerol-3-phosphate transport system permease component
MAGYALARLQWTGRDKHLKIVVLLFVVPFEPVAIPLLFYMFFLSFPKSIEEAARADGLGCRAWCSSRVGRRRGFTHQLKSTS